MITCPRLPIHRPPPGPAPSASGGPAPQWRSRQGDPNHEKALLCTFFSCSEYRDLKKSIEVYEKNGGKSKPAPSR